MNEPKCACFEYIGDNPYCPVHGKEADEPKAPKATEGTQVAEAVAG
jgi:hypothetical protein